MRERKALAMPPRKWTDERLREVIATSTTWVAVLQGLGLTGKGDNHYRVAWHARQLGLDTSHFGQQVRLATDEALRGAIAVSHTFEEVATVLDLDAGSRTRGRLQKRARVLGIDTSHFAPKPPTLTRTKRRRWTDEQLRDAVRDSLSLAQTLRRLGLIAAGGNYDQVQRRITELGIDTSHLRGRGWNVGLKYDPRAIAPLSEVLVAGRWTSSHHLKVRLFREGLKEPSCELCGWAGRSADGRIPLELDHVNGDRNDNRLENLRIL
ncbi:MAG TPA: HNH endonuclease, partial [Kofleriaceae bacterium]